MKLSSLKLLSHISAASSDKYLPRQDSFYRKARQQGKIGWIFLWLIGIPVPILLLLFLLRGCT